MAAAVSFPYVADLPLFKFKQMIAQYAESSGSLHAFITFTGRAVARLIPGGAFELSTFSWIAKVVLWALVGIFAIYQFRRAWLGWMYAPNEVASRWTSILFAIIFIGSSQFYSWYIGMLFPLSLLGAGRSRLTEIIVMLSGTHMLFAFLRSKAIGYFIISTAVPIALVLWRQRKSAEPESLLLSWKLRR